MISFAKEAAAGPPFYLVTLDDVSNHRMVCILEQNKNIDWEAN